MFATFPVKPTTPNRTNLKEYEYKPPPKHLKREHRGARIFEPISPRSPDFLPTRPPSAHTQERAAPILALPGLPPLTLPHQVIEKPKERPKGLVGVLDSGRTWLNQIKPPWAPKVKLKIPPTPTTPNTAKFVNEEGHIGYTPKSAAFRVDFSKAYAEAEEADLKSKDPPPLYTKHPPEGGIRAWITVAAAFIVQFCTIGYLFTWNVFEDNYTHSFMTDQNPIAIRFIGSVQWFLVFFLALVGGKLADSGFFRRVVLAGSILFSSSLLILSFVPEEQFGLVFLTQAIGMGTGIGLVFVPTATVAAHYFIRQRGFAIGIVMSGGSFGGMIFPAVLNGIMPKRGMASAVRVTAGIIIVFLIIANGIFFKFPPPKEEEKPNFPLPRLDLAKYTKEMHYIFAAGSAGLAMLFIYYPVWYLDLIGLDRGVDPKSAFNSVMVLSFTGILGRIGFGYASGKVGAWNLLIPVSGFTALMMLTLCTVQSKGALVGFSIFYGIFSGAWLSLLVTALASLASRNSEIGTRVGLILSLSSFGQLFSALLQDLTLTPKHLYVIPSMIAGVMFIGVTALVFLSRKSLGPKIHYRKRKYLPKIYSHKYKFQIL